MVTFPPTITPASAEAEVNSRDHKPDSRLSPGLDQDEIAIAALHACVNGDIDKLQELIIKQPAMVTHDHPVRAGETEPLICTAAGDGHDRIVRYLLEQGADKNAYSSGSGSSALMLAADGGYYQTALILIDYGADVNWENHTGKAALFCAAQRGHNNIVRLLLDRGAHTDQIDKQGETALHYAAAGNNRDVVKELIAAGTPLNVKGEFGDTALHIAVMDLKDRDPSVGKQITPPALPDPQNDNLVADRNVIAENHRMLVLELISAGVLLDIQDQDGDTALHIASGNGNIELAEVLINARASLNVQNSNGSTPLHFALANGHDKLAEKLIIAGARFDLQNHMGESTLHLASAMGKIELIKTFIKASFYPDISSSCSFYGDSRHSVDSNNGNSAVLEAALTQRKNYLKTTGKRKNNLRTRPYFHRGGKKSLHSLNIQNDEGCTALALAIKNGHVEVSKLLVTTGAVSPDLSDEDGFTALHLASERGYIDLVALLIEAGAGVNLQTDRGFSALYLAARKGHGEVVSQLIKARACLDIQGYYTKNSALHASAQHDRKEAAVQLIAGGASLDIKDDECLTPLHWAANNDSVEVARLLIAKGAALEALDHTGKTPLYYACHNGGLEVFKLLMEAKVSCNKKCFVGYTPLHYTVRFFNLLRGGSQEKQQIVRALIEANCYLDEKTSYDGSTALHFAAEEGDIDSAIQLIEAGASVDIQNDNGDTALHLAVKNERNYFRLVEHRHKEEVQRLIAEKASLAVKNSQGSTALHIAVSYASNLVQMLIDANASLDAQDNDGWTALHIAVFRKNYMLVQMLIDANASLDVQNNAGSSPLDLAARNNVLHFFNSID